MLIGILGNIGAGKSTMAKLIQKELGCELVSFAECLRKELKTTFSDSDVDFWKHDKQSTIRLEHQALNPQLAEIIKPYYESNGWNIPLRRLLQLYGTEYRRKQNPDYWIEALFLSLNPQGSYVIDDVRFYNEASMVTALGGYLIRISIQGEESKDTHASESVLNIPVTITYCQPDRNSLSRLTDDVEFILNILRSIKPDVTPS